MPLILYNLLLPPLFLLYLPAFIVKLIRRGGFTRNFWERFGIFSAAQRGVLAQLHRPVWIHAVSVGEVVAASGFIKRWQEIIPELSFVLSTTTTTGHAIAAKKLPPGVPLIYCPIDFPFAVRHALRRVAPSLLVIFEVEIWPNLVSMAARRGVPVALVNGRMSDRSARGYARHRWFFEPLFGRFSTICVQSTADADRVRRVCGTSVPVTVCNTMKFDQIPDADTAHKGPLLDIVFGTPEGRVVWTAGSTHPGEEALIVRTFKDLKRTFPGLRLVLAPRHHERAAEVEDVLRSSSLTYRLLSADAARQPFQPPVDVLLVNTTGELMAFYAHCDIAYVGKSLAGNSGGHNIIEPAIFAKPIVHGANMQNFRLVARTFRDAEATVEIPRDNDLFGAMNELCGDAAKRQLYGKRARAVVDHCRGAMDRTIEQLTPLLPTREHG